MAEKQKQRWKPRHSKEAIVRVDLKGFCMDC